MEVDPQRRSTFLVDLCRKKFGHALCIRLVFDLTARPECFHGRSRFERRRSIVYRTCVASRQSVPKCKPSTPIDSFVGDGGGSSPRRLETYTIRIATIVEKKAVMGLNVKLPVYERL